MNIKESFEKLYMSALGGAIVEAIVIDYGKEAVLKKLSDPQSQNG